MSGGLLSILISLSFATNLEGFATSTSDAKLQKAWNATARVVNKISRSGRAGGGIPIEASGVLISKNGNTGYVLTNAHVASCARNSRCRLQVYFELANGRKIKSDRSRVVKESLTKDIAIVSVQSSALSEVPALEIVESSTLNRHDSVFAIGYPEVGLRNRWQTSRPQNTDNHVKRISEGGMINTVSDARIRNYEYVDGRSFSFHVDEIIKHSSDTLYGNSGGPLVTKEGKLLGVNSAILGTARNGNDSYCYRHNTVGNDGLGCTYMAISAAAAVDALMPNLRN